ncbi:MAG: cytochrome bc complex cytochrome b subunit [Calditrichaeota bacterium]|nr:MAG: cytochrome bc complex cytochrome b subunit [Calditrichota bacterium]
MQAIQTLKQWFVESFPFDLNLLKEISSEPIPNHLKRWWFAIGGTPLYLFIIQATTGIILTFYYVPHPAEAFNSVAAITTEVRFGWFIRSVHRWSANLMIFTLFLHMMRVFFTAAYRKPRELNWMIGVGLLVTTLGFGFTGYSLIYEQISYWASVVGTNIAEATPLIGPLIANFIRGGPEVGPNTLTRFFVFHIGVLPTAMVMLLALHVVQVRLHGVTRLRFREDEQPAVEVSVSVAAPVAPTRYHGGESERMPEEARVKEETYPFFPDHFYTELIIGLTLTFILTILALVAPAHMGEPANPLVTPEHIKPEWYFYAMFRWLKLTSFQVGVVGSMFFLVILFFWPFVDRFFQRRWPGRDVSFWIGVVGFLVFLTFTIWEALV